MDEQLTREYFTDFAKNDEELYVGEVDNAAAAGWAERNIPLFSVLQEGTGEDLLLPLVDISQTSVQHAGRQADQRISAEGALGGKIQHH